MKLLKKTFYGICILIVVCCGVVLVCALNPSLTQSLSAMFAGNLQSGDVEIEMLPPIQGNTEPENESIFQGNLNVPALVAHMMGYEPVTGQEEQIAEEEAELLESSLETGPTGENLTFDTQMYPYYGMLSVEQQAMYRQIYANTLELRQSFKPAISFQHKELKNVFEAVYNDHPELFWLETAYSCKYLENGQCLEITLKYNETIDNYQEAKQKFDARVQEIIVQTERFSQLDKKQLIVHDVLVESVIYEADAAMAQSAYSALVNGKSVCAGYARAFQYIMQQIGVPCYYCTGISNEDHAWNIIKIGGRYYNVDVTWDDTDPSTYDYYNKTDSEYAATHVRTGMSVNLPACVENASDADIYVEEKQNKPLEWPLEPFGNEEDYKEDYEEKQRRLKEENLKKAGITEDEVLDNMEEYYADCLLQMEKQGAGIKSFTNVIPQNLWAAVEQAYTQDKHKAGYVDEALKKISKENFTIQLQVENLGGGYYRIYHNITTW